SLQRGRVMKRCHRSRWLCAPALERLEERDVPAIVGGLDPSFHITGKGIYSNDFGNEVAVDSLGRIVVAGLFGLDMEVIRLTPDGQLDTTFGSGGEVLVDFAGGDDT